MPADGYVSMIVKDADGVVVRQLLTAETVPQGERQVAWDGLTTPILRKPGDPVEPGAYSWHAIWHTGIGLRLRGWAYHGPSDPWDVTPTSYWGGDHGVPVACATDGTNVYLGWAGAEVGKAIVALGPDDNVIWGGGFHFNSAGLIAADSDSVYYVSGGSLRRLDPRTGRLKNWDGRDSGDLDIADIWGEDAEGWPTKMIWNQGGLAAHNGTLYLSFAQMTWERGDVRDWRKFLTSLTADEGPVGRAIWSRLNDRSRRIIPEWLDSDTPEDEALGQPNYWTPDVRDVVIGAIRSLGNRRMVEQAYPDDIVRMQKSFLATVDGRTGRFLKRFDLAAPGKIVAVRDDLVYLFTERSQLTALNPKTGETRLVVGGLRGLGGLAIGPAGNIYIGVGQTQQVHVFSPEGRELRRIGKPRGRVKMGPWNPMGMNSPWGVTVDAAGRLWVAEGAMVPKRVSVWNAESGEFIKEFFGPTHYGASGACINPRDPNLMVGESCEFRIDPTTGRATLREIVTREYPQSASRFCQGANGRLYYAAIFRSRLWQIGIWERLEGGGFKYRAVIRSDPEKGQTLFWADENGDQRSSAKEVRTFPMALQLGGYEHWSMSMNTDLTLYGTTATAGYQVKVGDFTKAGAPIYDLDNAKELPLLRGGPLSSPDNRLVVSCDAGDELFRCYDTETGALRWTYPNTFHGVHGAYYCPGPAAGLIRAAFGFVGNAELPPPVGAIWAINSNVGEWHVLTEDGYYLTRLFQGDEAKQRWPEKAVPGAIMDNAPPGLGGEDFGGSMVQGTNGAVYIQAGKLALWNLEVVGLDTIKELGSGSVDISADDQLRAVAARERLVQQATPAKSMTMQRLTPTFTGDMHADFDGAEIVRFDKGEGHTVQCAAAWDKRNLYLAWHVIDPTPWQNGADEPRYMYTNGDTVDFQLGTNPKAPAGRESAAKGDIRISIGNFNGQPVAVLFEERGKSPKGGAKTFSSGVVPEFVVQRVEILKTATVRVTPGEKHYVVEASIPLRAIGLKRPRVGHRLQGDFGATFGDRQGRNTALRSHWSNQGTGIVSDEVFELRVQPTSWGMLTVGAGKSRDP